MDYDEYDVFISYSSKDQEIANKVCAAIELKGVKCWIAPRNIETGEEWREAIVRGLSICKITQ